ncbi:receptor-like protein kinase FERONIA isoform X2 [Fagus crenata]
MKSLSNLTPIFFVFFTFHHICHFRTATSTESTARCNTTLISCGNTGVSTASDGRDWTGDMNSEFCSFEEHGKESNLSRSTAQGEVVPYMTVRIFPYQFTYIFPVDPGQKFVRLHFNPVSYQGFDRSKAIFTVKSENQTLNLTFTPQQRSSVYYAFINGVEIVSMPEDLYYRPEGQSPTLIYVGQSPQFYINYSMTLEMVFRLNAPSFKPKFSKIPNYTAPDDVYGSARSMGVKRTKNLQSNLTWRLPIDLGFNYLVRLHFCEIDEDVNSPTQRRFIIDIDYRLAEPDADVILWTDSQDTPYYKDYVVMIQNKGVDKGKEYNLSIDLHPGPYGIISDAILNGIEVFKLSNIDGNLAKVDLDVVANTPDVVANTPVPAIHQPTAMKSKTKKRKFIAIGIEKSDVYAFGEVLLEGKIAPKCFKVFVLIAESCTRDEGIQRPTMGDVVEKLKFALEVQENADAENESMNPGGEYIYSGTLSFFIDATGDGPWATNEHGMTSDSGTVTGLMDSITTQQDIMKNTTNV